MLLYYSHSGKNINKEALDNLEIILSQWEQSRKHPLQMLKQIYSTTKNNLLFPFKYFLGKASIENANAFLSNSAGINIKLLSLPDPLACVDLDTLDDYKFLSTLFPRE